MPRQEISITPMGSVTTNISRLEVTTTGSRVLMIFTGGKFPFVFQKQIISYQDSGGGGGSNTVSSIFIG